VEYDEGGNVTLIEISQSILIQNDRIRRIGSVQMSYNSFALERVGGLRLSITEEAVVDIFWVCKVMVEGMYITKITIIDI
jgi:hypothetical protein